MSDERFAPEEVALLNYCNGLLKAYKKTPDRETIIDVMRAAQEIFTEGAEAEEVKQVSKKLKRNLDTDIVLIAMLPDMLFEIMRRHDIGTIDLEGGVLDDFVKLLIRIPGVAPRMALIGRAGKLIGWREALEKVPLLGDAADPKRAHIN